MPIEKECIVCGKTFFVPPTRKDTAKTCSHKCAVGVRAKSKERKVEVVCQSCGRVFLSPKSQAHRRVYCTKACKSIGGFEAKRDRATGSKNPMWKGGESTNSEGYVSVTAPNHPFAWNGRILKHRLKMEEWLRDECPESEFLVTLGNQKYLSPSAEVHHLDEVKNNNRRRNLMVGRKGTNSKIHNGTMPEPGTYWPPNAKIKLGNPRGFAAHNRSRTQKETT